MVEKVKKITNRIKMIVKITEIIPKWNRLKIIKKAKTKMIMIIMMITIKKLDNKIINNKQITTIIKY